MKLADVARSRAGDKGDHSILVLRAVQSRDFARIVHEVSASRIAAHFRVPEAYVQIEVLPRFDAMTIVVRHRLAGGVTRSPHVDPHGKTLSGHLLDMAISW